MSRRPLKPINLNLKLNMPSPGAKTRPSMSQTKIMAADHTELSPTVGLNSPVTNLAMNMSELSTRRATPKRRLSLNSIDTPPFEEGHASVERTTSSASSTESGVFFDSPTLIDSPTLEQKKTIAFRRINSLPPPSFRLDNDSPTEFGDCMDVDEQCHSAPATSTTPSSSSQPVAGPSTSCAARLSFFPEDASSQDSGDVGFKMPAPVSFIRRKSRLNDICEETNSPLKYSPVKSPQKRPLSFSLGSFQNGIPEDDSPVRLKRSSIVSSENDDGFLDLNDHEVSEINERMPAGMSSLMNDPVLEEPSIPVDTFTFEESSSSSSTPVSRKILPAKRYLRRSQSVDVRCKRSEPPEDLSSHNKRWKAEESHDDMCITDHRTMHVPRLHRSQSETAEMIMSAVHRLTEEPDLIADSSKPHALPMVTGKHQDLKSITPETLALLMNGAFQDQVEEFQILDCRYPYEFDGGHIENALNIYTKDELLEEYLKNPKHPQDPNKRLILVFHCEFSSERGPSLYRFLRSKDRESNKECYPLLHYPELYLLEGGYKAFYQHHKHLCEPQTYTPMLHKNFSEELRKFRAKSKSWAGEKSGSRTGLRKMKY